MSLEPMLSIVHHWARSRAKVAVVLSSERGRHGGRRWALRLGRGAERLELPLEVATSAGLELCVDTRTATAWCAGMFLRELGAVPVDIVGAPLFPEPGPETADGLPGLEVIGRRR